MSLNGSAHLLPFLQAVFNRNVAKPANEQLKLLPHLPLLLAVQGNIEVKVHI